MANDNSKLLTVPEALTILGISRATFDRWKKDKQLPYTKIGKEVFINREKLLAWMESFNFADGKSKGKPIHTINIGYQTGSAQLWSSIVIKHLRLIEQQLKTSSLNEELNIVWHNANNGIELVQQFISNQLNLIAVGDYPIHISFNLARLFPNFNPLLIAFDGKSINNEGIALVTQPHINLDDHALDIATVASTSSAYHLQQLMKKRSQSCNPIAKPTMEKCMTSFLQQEVDAAMLWEPYLTIVEQLGAGTRFEEADDAIYLTGILANYDQLQNEEQQEITIAYLKALLIAHELLLKEDYSAMKAIEEETGLSIELIKKVISHIRYDAAVYYDDIKRINRIFSDSITAQSLQGPDLGALPCPKIQYDDAFLNQAIKELGLPVLPKKCLTGNWITQRY